MPKLADPDWGSGTDVKDAMIVASAAGDTTIVAAVPGKKIRVVSYVLSTTLAADVKWRSNTTDKTGVLSLDLKGGIVVGFNEKGWFETAPGAALVLNVSAIVGVGGHLNYIETV